MTGRTRVVVLSAGAWSRETHLPALVRRDDAEVVAISSPDPDRAAGIAHQFDIPTWSTDWRAVLALDPDAVVVSSPPVAHEEQVSAALEAGCHVLVEKPFALTSESARRMCDVADRSTRSLLVGLGWNRTPVFTRLRELVRRGTLGTLELAQLELSVHIRDLLAAEGPGTYQDVTVSGGGAAAVSMSHQLGLLLFLSGQDVQTLSAHTYPSASRLDLHDCVTGQLAGGAAASLVCVTGHRRGHPATWRVRMVGSTGEVIVDTELGTVRRITATGAAHTDRDPGACGYAAAAPTDALVEVARGAQVPTGLDCRLSQRVVELTEAVYAGARPR